MQPPHVRSYSAPRRTRFLRRIAAAAGVVVLCGWATGPHAADPADPDWPCQQRKVAAISAGQVWSGPPLEGVGESWREDPLVADLARRLAERRIDLEQAKSLVSDFAANSGPDRAERLTRLAAGMLTIINRDRASIIAGIERYAKRQRALAARIEQQSAELLAMPTETEDDRSRRADLQEVQDWDERIFQEREHSLTYVCELPVELERRAFALGREIARYLEP
jgi:hypothetical protein